MSLRISFELREADLRHFEELAQQTQSQERRRSAESIIAAARDVLADGERAHLAEFVKERFARLRAMLEMATDADWQVSGEDQQRIINALGCFSAAPQANGQPVTAGLLDHAIMIELVSRDLEHDLVAFRDFCKFRESQLNRRAGHADLRQQQLEQRRTALHTRMHTRRQRDLDRAGSSVRKLFSLFGL